MQVNTENNLSINERIFQVLDYYGDTRYKFSKKTGISESSILNIYKAKNKPGYDFIEKLLLIYEAIDARWLITGNGSMFIETSQPISSKNQLSESPCRECEQRERTIISQEKTIHLLEEKIETLQGGKRSNQAKDDDIRQTG